MNISRLQRLQRRLQTSNRGFRSFQPYTRFCAIYENMVLNYIIIIYMDVCRGFARLHGFLQGCSRLQRLHGNIAPGVQTCFLKWRL